MPIYDDANCAYFGYPSRPGATPGAIDFSPHGRHGHQAGTVGPTSWEDSATLGRPALVFPGTGTGFDDLGRADLPLPGISAGTFTVAFWSRMDVARNQDMIGTKANRTTTGNTGFSCGWDNIRRTHVSFSDGVASRSVLGVSQHPLTTWLHVVHEWDRASQQYRCWVNNVAQTFFDSTDLSTVGSLASHLQRMTFGALRAANGFHSLPFAGRLADVMILPRVLTSQERADLADPQFKPYTPPAGGSLGPSMHSPYLIGEELSL